MHGKKEEMMDKLNVEFHVSVLTVPNFVTPEQFPQWLHGEASAIQEVRVANSLTILRLFLAARIKQAWPREKLDVLLQEITDQYPHIFRVDMLVIDYALDIDQKERIQSDGEKGLAEILQSVRQFQELKNTKNG